MAGVTFPPFANTGSTGLAQKTTSGASYQTPFSTAGLWDLAAGSGVALFGAKVGSPATHNLVPIINGRRRLVTVFP
jgi:hypothetical protein